MIFVRMFRADVCVMEEMLVISFSAIWHDLTCHIGRAKPVSLVPRQEILFELSTQVWTGYRRNVCFVWTRQLPGELGVGWLSRLFCDCFGIRSVDPIVVPLHRGRFLMKEGNFDGAIEEFSAAIDINPKSSMAFNNRATARFAARDLDGTIGDLDRAIELDAANTQAIANRGFAWLDKQEYEKAITDFDEVIRQNANFWGAYINRGFARSELGDFDAAISDYTEAIRLVPTDSCAYNKRAHAWCDVRNYDAALGDFTKLIQIAPRDGGNYLSRGWVWEKKGNHDAAIADYSKALSLNPNESHAYVRRGICFVENGEYALANADINKALRIDPTNAIAWVSRGICSNRIGEYTSAIADFNEAVNHDPSSVYALNILAWFLATCPDDELRDGLKAVEYATKACELSFWKEAAYVDTLAAAHAESGEWELAIQRQQEAIDLDTEEDWENDRVRLELYKARKPYREERKRISKP